jgi:hypothetical protein
MNLSYHIYLSNDIPTNILEGCSKLFSMNYGTWNISKKNIKLSVSRLEEKYLFDKSCFVVVCICKDIVIGQAFYSICKKTCWFSQLVVDKNYRKEHIASTLLSKALNREDWKYAGLVTSNPYAVRALERATGFKCDPVVIQTFATEILRDCKIPYLKNSVLELTNEKSIIDTHFDIDHREIETFLEQELQKGWRLGNKLPEGYEFFAFVKKGLV